MKKKSMTYYVICFLVVFCGSCTKNNIINKTPDPTTETPVTPPPTPAPPPAKPAADIKYSKVYDLGTGSGNLLIDGKSLTLSGNVLIKIKGGKYSSIKIIDINSTTGIVTIQNNGLIEMINSEMRLENLNNVTITGNGTSGIEKGFVFKDNDYRALAIDGTVNNFTFQYASFKNINDNVITYKYDALYNGSENSYSKNLKFLHISCENTGQFLSGAGTVENGLIEGYIKNIEIADLNFKNSADVGTVVWLGNVEDYDIHHNIIDNINTTNNNHNGIFLINGNGKFHHNKVSNHQGNAIRAFSFSVGTTPKKVLIYNNIVFNSRKYSAFEVQAFDYNIMPGKSTFVNAEVFNNTCGTLNTSNAWQGNLVDVYGLKGGKCNVYNNLAFNLPEPHVIAGQVSELIPIASNNFYFATSAQAGITDEKSFRLNSNSPAKLKGISNSLVIDDFYGTRRSVTPSVGAVE